MKQPLPLESPPRFASETWGAREIHLRASPEESSILLPDGSFLLQGSYARDGFDLVITSRSGEVIRIEGYFALSHPPDLALANGSALTFETVKALALSDNGPVLTAGPGAPTGGEAGAAIGKAASLTGTVEAKGKDGVVRTLKEGDPIQEGDQITTAEQSLAQFVMNDGTTFQVGESARALVDQFIFKPDEAKGQFNATVLTGSFRYASGQIGQLHTGKHTLIKTPTAEIGVRGSELMGEVVTDGSTTVVHNSGILEIADIHGHGVVVLLKPGTATAVRLGGGAPTPVFQAPEALLKRLEGQVSSLAIIKAKETEKFQQEKLQKPEEEKHGTDPGEKHDQTGEKSGGEKSDEEKSGGGKPVEEPHPGEKPVEEPSPSNKDAASGNTLTWETVPKQVTPSEIKAFAESLLTAASRAEEATKQLIVEKVTTVLETGTLPLDNFEVILPPIINLPPVLPDVAAQVVVEKGAFSLALTGWSDPDGQQVTLKARLADGGELPAWLHFDATTGRFSGTPANADVGQLAIDLVATDTLSLATHQIFTLTIANRNDAPVLVHPLADLVPRAERVVLLKPVDGGYQAISKDGTPFSLRIPASTFLDADLAVDSAEWLSLSVSLVDFAGQEHPLPDWRILENSLLTMTDSIADDQVGSYRIRVTATDRDGMAISDTFLVSVRIADAPYAEVEQGFFIDSPVAGLTYVVDGMTGTTDAQGGFYYHPGETITFSLGGLVLGEIPTEEIASAPVTLTPQELARGATGTVDENHLTNLLRLLQTLDADHDPENGILLATSTLENARDLQLDLSLAPDAFASQDSLHVFLASEHLQGLIPADQARAHFEHTLEEGIERPASAWPQWQAIQDQPFSITLPNGLFVDPHDDPLTYSATLADGTPLPAWLSFSSVDPSFSWTPEMLPETGTYFVRLLASNAHAHTTGKIFQLIVGEGVAPTLTLFSGPVGVIDEDTPATITLVDLKAQGDEADANGAVTAFVIREVNSGTLMIGTSAGSASAWVAGTNDTVDATHHAWWRADPDANGLMDAFAVVARDDGNMLSSTPVAVRMEVMPVDDAPVVIPPTISTLAENSDTSFVANFTDIDDATVTWSLSGDDAVSFTIDASGAMKFITSPDFEKPTDTNGDNVYQVIVQASDGQNTASRALAVTVTNLNDLSPVLTAQTTVSVAENGTSVTTVSGSDGDV
ncbi:MAG: putative Ig domain-containing protein, partial [Magnetococcus sp. YQC-9]